MTTSKVTPDDCARAVMETIPLVMRFLRAEMRRHGAPLLSVPQFRALAFLHRNPDSCLFSVADHLGVTRPTASVIVDRLVRRGLLARIEDPQERRRIHLSLTAKGARLFEQARSATRSWMATRLSRLPASRLRKIAQGVGLLGGVFKDAEPQNDR